MDLNEINIVETEKNALKRIIRKIPLKLIESTQNFNSDKDHVLVSNDHVKKISINWKKREIIEQITPIFSSFPSLEELYLYLNQLNIIPQLDSNGKLRHLGLSGNKISKIEHLEELKSLKTLELGNNRIKKIENLAQLAHLQELNLSKNQINEIEKLDELEGLQILNLSDNKITEISGLKKTRNLQELYLDGNMIKKIKGLLDCKELKILSLEDNRIKNISGLHTLNNLEDLYLKGNPLKKEFQGYDQYNAEYWVSYCKRKERGYVKDIPIISFIGHSQSGKTTVVEELISYLTSQGVEVFALKHINKQNFTIDKKGKNTWRFTQAGAKGVVAQSPNESAIMFNWELDPLSVIKIIRDTALQEGKISRRIPYVFLLEGFRDIAVTKILCAKDFEDIKGQIDPSVITIAGSIFSNDTELVMAKRKYNLEFINLLEQPQEILKILNSLFPDHFKNM